MARWRGGDDPERWILHRDDLDRSMSNERMSDEQEPTSSIRAKSAPTVDRQSAMRVCGTFPNPPSPLCRPRHCDGGGREMVMQRSTTLRG
ncbi:Os01g0254825 [Oryza sativa Japonica Group]|uniref:Os01g0254825 protein n=1 Tax=Oryza sativa subsp. japonica TaxID=39947 RepID=A0A0P0V0R3_ORYSJ|nr:Os01g0254825 [Oryza sativa Japonica Group]